jgi:hypothetical protein
MCECDPVALDSDHSRIFGRLKAAVRKPEERTCLEDDRPYAGVRRQHD